MKKMVFHNGIVGIALVAMVVAAFAAAGCASLGVGASGGGSGRRIADSGRTPQFVKDALKKVPENALVGIGTARHATISLSRTTAATRARADISRQLNTMIQDMVRDYSAGSEVDHSATVQFTENITVALSKSNLQGSSVVEEDEDKDGNYWCVVMLSKSDVAKEINQATAAAKLAVPAMASFSAEERMDEAFAKAEGQPLQIKDN